MVSEPELSGRIDWEGLAGVIVGVASLKPAGQAGDPGTSWCSCLGVERGLLAESPLPWETYKASS